LFKVNRHTSLKGLARPPVHVDVPRIVSVALLISREQVLLLQRPDDGPLPGQWEFPGGKVEFGEHPWDALRRELREELHVRLSRGDLFGIYSYVYDLEGTRVHYVLAAYLCPIQRARIRETPSRKWAVIRDLPSWPVVLGSRPIVADLRRRRRRVT
jgi:8-oxo-dGTP diphosphatase